jgi:adenosine deaminase
VTVHAGEAAGLESIADALHLGLAQRIGHGMRIADDVTLGEPTDDDPYGVGDATLGPLAHWVRDTQTTLELCPTSNVQTGAAASVAAHPISALNALGFAVTVNTDNRLMCGTSLSEEMFALVAHAGWDLDDLRDATLTAAWSTFCHFDERAYLVGAVIEPAYTETNGHH